MQALSEFTLNVTRVLHMRHVLSAEELLFSDSPETFAWISPNGVSVKPEMKIFDSMSHVNADTTKPLESSDMHIDLYTITDTAVEFPKWTAFMNWKSRKHPLQGTAHIQSCLATAQDESIRIF
ncbi:hypothetical protein L345_09470, partial [Ophiophagus hannah]